MWRRVVAPGSCTILSPEDLVRATIAGRRRTARGGTPSSGIETRGAEDVDLIGACGELAFSRISGLPWTAEFDRDVVDVAPYDVRSTTHAAGRLIIRERDDPTRSTVLMVRYDLPPGSGGAWRFAGMLPNAEASTVGVWAGGADGRHPCYWVAQRDLRGIEVRLSLREP